MGNKSYWMADQKGTFSNDGKDTFDPKKGYVGVRLQQGVPLLDRDWNELEDIRRYQEMILRKSYLGNGTPDDGFKISQCDKPADDFRVSKGRYLIDGYEAVNEPDDNTGFVLYSKHAEVVPPLEPLASNEKSRLENIYIDLWISEITGAGGSATPNEFQDPVLDNLNDVKICTSVRHKIQWRIRVAKVVNQTDDLSRLSDHYYCRIASINRLKTGIAKDRIQDLRSNLQSLENAEKQLEYEKSTLISTISTINTILSGNIPSDQQQRISTSKLGFFGSPMFAEFRKTRENNIWCFYIANLAKETQISDYGIFATEYTSDGLEFYRVLNSHVKLNSRIQLWEDTKSKIFPLEDPKGVMWLYWVYDNQIYSSKFNSRNWEEPKKPLEESNEVYLVEGMHDVIKDPQGNKWIIWKDAKETVYSSSFNSDGKLLKTEKMLDGVTSCRAIGDRQGDILVLLTTGSGNIISRSFSFKSPVMRPGEPAGKSTGKSTCDFLDVIELVDDQFILFWKQDDVIYCRYWHSGSWSSVENVIAISGGKFLDVIEDPNHNHWLFWKQNDNVVRAKKRRNGVWDKGLGLRVQSSMNDVLRQKICSDSRGAIWFIFQNADSGNIWCSRYIDGDWLREMRLTSGESPKTLNQAIEGNEKGILLFWQEKQIGSTISGDGDIQCKRCFDLI